MNKLILTSLVIGITAITFTGCVPKKKTCSPTYSKNPCGQNVNMGNYQQTPVMQPTTQQPVTQNTAKQPEPVKAQKQQQCHARNDIDVCEQPNLIENDCAEVRYCDNFLARGRAMTITVVGQGVSPQNTISPAQAYALAKRAAIADAYRLIAEKVKGVKVEGEDYIKNMMVQRTQIRTYVQATIRNSNIVETTFKEGLCEVEMEIKLYYADFVPHSSYIY